MAWQAARVRNIFSLVARTATPTSNTVPTPAGTSAVRARVNATAITTAPSVVFKLQGQAPDATWYDMLTSTAVVAVSTRTLTVGTGITASANVAAIDVIPANVRLVATHANGDSITYSATLEFFG